MSEYISVNCFDSDNVCWEPVSLVNRLTLEKTSVWRIHIPEYISYLDLLKQLLSEDESARALRYHFEKDSHRFIISRGILRIIIGQQLSLHPKHISFAIGKNKKPFVDNSTAVKIHYNVAHSGDWILVATGRGDLGVDVEFIDPAFDYLAVMEHSFSKPEITLIQNSPTPRRDFYVGWTRKESITKGTTKGITDDYRSTICLTGVNSISPEIIDSRVNWNIQTFPVAPAYIGSIAYQPSEHTAFCDLVLADLISFRY